jgi:hypothetical protein
MKKIVLIVAACLFLVCLLYYFICGMTYSEGERAGTLIKISKKGYIFKTYEGQLNLNPLGMSSNNLANGNGIWEFSASNADTYDKLLKMEGQKVSLHYRQVYKKFFWQGDSDYFVDEVELIQ